MIPKKNCYLLFKNVMLSMVVLASFVFALFGFRNFLARPSSDDTATLDHSAAEIVAGNNQSFSSSGKKLSIEKIETAGVATSLEDVPIVYKTQIFYYPWYGNPKEDSVYLHWNHEYLPNWDKTDSHEYPSGRHEPPQDIGANFYPLLGCYSSKDPEVVDQHMRWIREAGVGVLVISWYPPDQADGQGQPFDKLFPMYLDIADKYKLKVAFHIEPYEGRNPENFREHIRYIIQQYGNHSATYKLSRSSLSKTLPVFYVYDSYMNPPNSWNELLGKSGMFSVRNTELDAIFLGLLVELRHKQDIVTGGFDGFYTYFAATEFSYGSSWKNWKALGSFARKNRLLFVPSVGPGYVDTRIRPWNGRTTRPRKNGKYYKGAWKSAILSGPSMISITSFNEWHEGTQIEPAIPMSDGDYIYEDYSPDTPTFYLNMTRQYVLEYAAMLDHAAM